MRTKCSARQGMSSRGGEWSPGLSGGDWGRCGDRSEWGVEEGRSGRGRGAS